MSQRKRTCGRWGTLLVSLLLLMGVTACGDDDDDSQGSGSSDGIELIGAWGRATPPNTEVTAFYVNISNNATTPDQLVSAASEACGMTELHNTTMGDDEVMQMAPASSEELTVAANASLSLAPNGLHVMCMQVVEPLEVGDEVELDLEFAEAGTVSTTVVIEER